MPMPSQGRLSVEVLGDEEGEAEDEQGRRTRRPPGPRGRAGRATGRARKTAASKAGTRMGQRSVLGVI